MNNIVIRLDQTDFAGGDRVQGEVILELEQSLPLRGVRLALRGHEKSYWTTGSGKSRRTHTETREFFNEEITLFGKAKLSFTELIADSCRGLFSKDNYEFLGPGCCRYPFAYTLPPLLPADYQSDGHSEISYQAQACVGLPLQFDLKAVQPLTVYERYDAQALTPVRAEKSKSFLFDAGSGLALKASLARSQYLPGRTAVCQLEIDNKSGKTVEAVKVSLQKVETLHAHGSERNDTTEVSSVTYDDQKIPAHKWAPRELSFPIPTGLSPTITSSSLVQVRYELRIQLVIPWAIDLKVSLPVTLLEKAGVPSGSRED